MSTIETRLTSSFFTAAAILIAALGVLFFYHLDEDEVSSEDEARILLTAQEMNRAETWRLPVTGGQERWEKPPLYVWTVKLASMLTNGEVTPLASRLPGAVAMSLLVLLASWWAYQHFSAYSRSDGIEINPEGFALLSGLILATTPQIMNLARSGVNDSVFACFCFGAIYCLGQSFEVRRSFFAGRSWRQWVLLAYFLIGLAMLTKGPAAFLFVLIPYMAMCWTYKLRRPDAIHLAGLGLALAVGGWWYAAAALGDPEAKQVFINELLRKRFGPDAESHRPFYFYVELLVKSYTPWVFLAGAMVYRNLRLGERTPTLVAWSCALLSGAIWLSVVGSKRDEYFLPVAPFVMLLAGDALMRWDFDSRVGTGFRVLIRLWRYALIVALLPLSILLGSESGLVLFVLAVLICAMFAIHRRRTAYTYAVWERTVHGAALLVFVLGVYEVVYTLDIVTRSDLRNRTSAFMEQVSRHLPEEAEVYIFGNDDSALMSYYLKRLPKIVHQVKDLELSESVDTYLISDTKVKDLAENPRLVPLVVRTRGNERDYRSAMFRYVPASQRSDPLTGGDRYADLPPLELAVLGNAGRGGYDRQREMARLMDDLTEKAPLNGVLMLGDALTDGTILERIDFYASFERPYRHQLRDGIPFYGLLGNQDQEIAWLVTRYPLLQMGKARYYVERFYGGLADYFALDSALLAGDGPASEEHWRWIEEELAKSTALWKIVGTYRPLVSCSPEPKVDAAVAKRLLPLLDRHGVDVVLSSEEPSYQRIEPAEHHPVFIIAGWSGVVKNLKFESQTALKASHVENEGFVHLEIRADSIRYRAIAGRGKTVDRGLIRRGGAQAEADRATEGGDAASPGERPTVATAEPSLEPTRADAAATTESATR